MVLRQIRRSVASIAAVAVTCLAPSWSQAGTQILVEEINSSGNVIANTAQIFSTSSNGVVSQNFTLGNFSNVAITANPNSGAISSLTTTVNATPVTSFDPTIGIRVIVTSDGFSTPNVGGNAVVSNNAAASSAIGNGQNQLTANTQLLNTPLTTPTSSTTAEATGTALGAATGSATDIRPSTAASPTTTATVQNFPGTFAIQQQIDVLATNVGAGGIQTGSTLGGSASSLVSTQPVPAPGGLALALIGLPLIGARRVFRKRATA